MIPRGWLAAAFLAGAAAAVYWNSLHVPFVFDDILAIERNESIRHIWPTAFHPPADTSVSGRPVLNLSFAVNHAISGIRVGSYHAGNVLIHILAGLTLFGFIRRTLLLKSGNRKSETGGPDSEAGADAALVAFAAALLWIVHPLDTESVTYVVQRAESLMGLCYLLTLYCFVRCVELEAEDERRKSEFGDRNSLALFAFRFSLFSACLIGMGTKETMASAPVIVLLYDRTFAAGSFREAIRRRRVLYAALAATWILVLALTLGTNSRNGTVGFNAGMKAWDYYLTQFQAIGTYLRLTFWPRGQIFDYGQLAVANPASVIPQAALIAALVGATVWAFIRRPWAGFFGIWFFAILSPTCLIPCPRQTTAEHRMYLALAPILALCAVGFYRACGRLKLSPTARKSAFLAVVAVLACALGAVSVHRNRVYRTNIELWQDTVAKNPGNAFARNNYANLLLAEGRIEPALAQYEEALRLKGDYPEGHNNHATALADEGRLPEAIAEYREAIRIHPGFYADAHNNLGVALMQVDDVDGALAEFKVVLGRQPENAEVHFNLANALAARGRYPEAIAMYRRALDLGVAIPEVHNNLANALAHGGRTKEALAEYVIALRMRPNYPDAYNNMGAALADAGRYPEAIRQYQQAVWLRPLNVPTRLGLANTLVRAGRPSEAETQYREVLQLEPDSREARNNLGNVLLQDGRVEEAVEEFREALRQNYNLPEVHNNLGAALLRLKKPDEARMEFETALRLKPGYDKARANLSIMAAPPKDGRR